MSGSRHFSCFQKLLGFPLPCLEVGVHGKIRSEGGSNVRCPVEC